jgi:hypothetical protein
MGNNFRCEQVIKIPRINAVVEIQNVRDVFVNAEYPALLLDSTAWQRQFGA